VLVDVFEEGVKHMMMPPLSSLSLSLSLSL